MKAECPFLLQFSCLEHAFFDARWKDTLKEHTHLPLSLVTLTQIHSTRVLTVTDPHKSYPEGDALVTNLKNVALGIFTADCAPILFYDPKAHIIGACHAGWRGAKEGIISETVNAMITLGASRTHIYATFGPTIQQKDYEVGPEFPDMIGESYNRYFHPSSQPGYHHFNLPLYIENLLSQEDLFHIHNLRLNTFDTGFSSRRRSLGLGKKTFDTNLSMIATI